MLSPTTEGNGLEEGNEREQVEAAPPTSPSPVPTTTMTPVPAVRPTAAPTATATAVPPFPTYTGPTVPTSNIGIQVHLRQEDQDQLFALLQELNVGWVKVQVSWKLYEPAPEAYAADRFAELDQFVDRAGENGIAVLISVAKAPEWSRPTTELDGPPSDFALFTRFTGYLAGRYAGRVAAYELGNEMNLRREWNGMPLDAAEFARFVQAGATGIRAVDPDVLIIAGAPAPTGINDGVQAVDDRVFFAGLVAAGAAEFVDAFGIHPYGWANPPQATVGQPDPAVPSHNDHPSFFFLDTIADYRRILQENGVEKPLWATEFGWGSFENVVGEDGRPVPPPPEAVYMTAVNEWQQAAYVQEAWGVAAEKPFMGPMFLWNLNFGPLLGTAFSETGFSILRPDGSARPVFAAIIALPRLD